MALLSMCIVHKTVNPVEGIAAAWRLNGNCHSYRSKSCLQKVISGRGLAVEVARGKNTAYFIKDYLKPVARMRYCISQLQDG